jgi:hypothetical protein
MENNWTEYNWNERTQQGEFFTEDGEGSVIEIARVEQPLKVEVNRDKYFGELLWYLKTQEGYNL